MEFSLLTAFAAIIITGSYLVVYSKMYDWQRSKMGLIMNLSLIASVTPAIGTVVYYLVSGILGVTIAGIGWIAFSVLLVWRLRELTYHYKTQKQKNRNNPELN